MASSSQTVSLPEGIPSYIPLNPIESPLNPIKTPFSIANCECHYLCSSELLVDTSQKSLQFPSFEITSVLKKVEKPWWKTIDVFLVPHQLFYVS